MGIVDGGPMERNVNSLRIQYIACKTVFMPRNICLALFALCLFSPAAELKVLHASLFPEVTSHFAPNLVSVIKAPKGKALLKAEAHLELKDGETIKLDKNIVLVAGGERIAPAGRIWSSHRGALQHVNIRDQEHDRSMTWTLLFIVPEGFRSGQIEWGPLRQVVRVKGASKTPSIHEDHRLKVQSARYIKNRRSWDEAGEKARDYKAAPMAGGILEVAVLGVPNWERKFFGPNPLYTREFSLMLPSRDLVVAFGSQSQHFEEEEKPGIAIDFDGRSERLLFAVPPGLKAAHLIFRGEPVGRVNIAGGAP